MKTRTPRLFRVIKPGTVPSCGLRGCPPEPYAGKRGSIAHPFSGGRLYYNPTKTNSQVVLAKKFVFVGLHNLG